MLQVSIFSFTSSLKYTVLSILAVLLMLSGSGCKEKNAETLSGKSLYSLYILDEEGNDYLLPVSSLDKDSVAPEQKGIKLDPQEMQRDLIVRDGYYYRKNGDRFVKYQTKDNALTEEGSLELKDFYLCNYLWINADTLLLIAIDKTSSWVKYAKVTVQNMQLVQNAAMEIQVPFGQYNFISVGFSILKNNRLFVGYAYHSQEPNDRYTTGDTTYIAVLSYPEMKLLNVLKDDRSTYPGGENTIEPGSFTDESGDFYFLTCPGVAMGNSPSRPTALYRIREKESSLDSSYFFNISASVIQNHAYSIYYIGNGKAIIRNERKDLFTSWNEHWKVPHFEFYLLDLQTKSATRLALPLDKGTRRQCVLVERDRVYISVNSDSDGNYIWIYNPKEGSLKKGLHLTGSSDFILRMDKLR